MVPFLGGSPEPRIGVPLQYGSPLNPGTPPDEQADDPEIPITRRLFDHSSTDHPNPTKTKKQKRLRPGLPPGPPHMAGSPARGLDSIALGLARAAQSSGCASEWIGNWGGLVFGGGEVPPFSWC